MVCNECVCVCVLSASSISITQPRVDGWNTGTLRDMCLSVCRCHNVTVWGFFWTLVGFGVMAASGVTSGFWGHTRSYRAGWDNLKE